MQNNEQAKLINACGMVQPVIVDVSPNKKNNTFNFMAVTNQKEAVSQLKWIAPQTIVFLLHFQ